jgi:dihydrofolate reductase
MKPADLLLGRKTFEIFASYWPEHANNWPGINDVAKYVASRTRKKSDLPAGRQGWKNSVFLKSFADINKLKISKGSDIKVWDSGELVQSLLKNDLVDELWLNNRSHYCQLQAGWKSQDRHYWSLRRNRPCLNFLFNIVEGGL